MNPIIIIIFNFITGTLSIMYGVSIMSSGLEKSNTKLIKKFLSKLTKRVSTAMLTGTIITAVVQSSTAITVITVGLVNSGILNLSQAIGIIYGANIGTTITAQLMSFNITKFSYLFLFGGLTLKLLSPKKTIGNIGTAIAGLGFVFIGLNLLNWGVPFIKNSQTSYQLFNTYGKNPFLGLVTGMITTMLVHSSGATVGITIVLFNSGLIGFEAALGLTFGDNIGTCITAQLASLGTDTAARRTAWAHTLYNLIGVIIAFTLLKPFSSLVINITSLLGQDKSRLVANAHTIFNVLSGLVFLPLTNYYVKFLHWIIPEYKRVKMKN